jgi:hypothetical protein
MMAGQKNLLYAGRVLKIVEQIDEVYTLFTRKEL